MTNQITIRFPHHNASMNIPDCPYDFKDALLDKVEDHIKEKYSIVPHVMGIFYHNGSPLHLSRENWNKNINIDEAIEVKYIKSDSLLLKQLDIGSDLYDFLHNFGFNEEKVNLMVEHQKRMCDHSDMMNCYFFHELVCMYKPPTLSVKRHPDDYRVDNSIELVDTFIKIGLTPEYAQAYRKLLDPVFAHIYYHYHIRDLLNICLDFRYRKFISTTG